MTPINRRSFGALFAGLFAGIPLLRKTVLPTFNKEEWTRTFVPNPRWAGQGWSSYACPYKSYPADNRGVEAWRARSMFGSNTLKLRRRTHIGRRYFGGSS